MKVIDLNEGLEEVFEAITDKAFILSRNIIVSVVGGTSTGKTAMVSNKIREKFSSRVIVKSQDNYYYDISKHPEIKKTVPDLNFDHRASIEMPLYERNLFLLKDDQPVMQPQYDFITTSRIGYEEFYPKKIIVAEGLFPVEADIKIFVNTDPFGMIIRRLMRDRTRSSWSDSETLRYMLEVAFPMHVEFTYPAQDEADFIIDNYYNPQTEAVRTGVFKQEVTIEGRPIGLTTYNYAKLVDVVEITKYGYTQFQGRRLEDQETLYLSHIYNKVDVNHEFTYLGPSVDQHIRPYLNFPVEKQHFLVIRHELGNPEFEQMIKREIYRIMDSNIYLYMDESDGRQTTKVVQIIEGHGEFDTPSGRRSIFVETVTRAFNNVVGSVENFL